MIGLDGRHPSTVQLARFFVYDHLPAGLPRDTSKLLHDVAEVVIDTLPDSPELTAGLRKLLEAKDCLVRTATDSRDDNHVLPS